MCARAAFNGKVPLTLQEYSISFVNFIIDIIFSISSWYCTFFSPWITWVKCMRHYMQLIPFKKVLVLSDLAQLFFFVITLILLYHRSS